MKKQYAVVKKDTKGYQVRTLAGKELAYNVNKGVAITKALLENTNTVITVQ